MRRKLQMVGAIGSITSLFSFAFLLPFVIALFYDPWNVPVPGGHVPEGALIFLFSFCTSYLLGHSLQRMARSVRDADLREREAYLTVGLGWLLLCGLAMIPFMLLGTLTNPVDAFFEAMSGLTTTGATVIAHLDPVPRSLLIWRAFLQYLGGMGIIVLSVAVLAKLTQGGRQMIQAEAPGPSVTSMAPRLAQTARILWGVYLTLTAVLFVLMFLVLWRHGMGFKLTFFETLLHTFTTIATGGFSSHDESIAYFNDVWLEALIVVFVLISGTNYSLHFYVIRGDVKRLLKDPEWRFFMAMVFSSIVAISLLLTGAGQSVFEAVRGAGFTTASLVTSTGYATADYDTWPPATKAILLLLMVTGATAGSTSGGMKHVRILLISKLVKREIVRLRHPSAVIPIRLGGTTVEPQTINAVAAFFLAFIGLWFAGTLALVSQDAAFSEPLDAASASIAALSNMGPALGVVGPTQNYAGLTIASKTILAFLMWFGRLEIFAALLVFTPRAWRY